LEKNEGYRLTVENHSKSSPTPKRAVASFFGGGLICFLGEWLAQLFLYLGLDEKGAYLTVTLSFIFLASLATALGFFDKIATTLGAGTLVPVTGFSNSVTSSAIDTRSEGLIAGVGTKIFTVAGPVILFGLLSGALYGVILYIYQTVTAML
jgi:stage V sporulation protein AC